MQILKFYLSLAIMMMSAPDAFGISPETGGKITWVDEQGPRIQVQLNKQKAGIEIQVHQPSKELPKSLEITFISPEGNRTSVQLKAIESQTGPNLFRGRLPGSLSTYEQSQIGFEFKIPFGASGEKIFKSESFKPVK